MSNSENTNEKQLQRAINALENEKLELTEWEENFCRSIRNQLNRFGDRTLSEKQLAILEKIEGYIANGRPSR